MKKNDRCLSNETLDRLLFEIRNEPERKNEEEFLRQKKAELLCLLSDCFSPEPKESSNRKAYSSDHTQIKHVAHILHDRLSENPDLNTLARIACMSPSKLKYTFKAITGYSIGQYRKRLRLEKSLQLLADPQLPLAEVARQLGYSKLDSFHLFFERATGMRPAEYRNYVSSHASEEPPRPFLF
jgi:AraC-like DNA-binding protein